MRSHRPTYRERYRVFKARGDNGYVFVWAEALREDFDEHSAIRNLHPGPEPSLSYGVVTRDEVRGPEKLQRVAWRDLPPDWEHAIVRWMTVTQPQ